MKVLLFSVAPVAINDINVGKNGFSWISSTLRIIQNWDNVEIFIAYVSDKKINIEKSNNISIYPIYVRRNYWNRIIKDKVSYDSIDQSIITESIKVVNQINPDIIHVFGTEWCFGEISKFIDIPVVLHMQGFWPQYQNCYLLPGESYSSKIWKSWSSPSMLLYYLYNKRLSKCRAKREEKIMRENKYFMGRTEWDKSLVKLYNPNAIYYHVEEALRKEIIESSIVRKRGDVFTIATIGSCQSLKGPDVALKTATLLVQNSKLKFKWLWIGGDKKDMACFESITGIKSNTVNIKMLGRKNSSEIIRILSDVDLYVQPSYTDNSPNSICEAQCLGLPIIASYAGGIPSLFDSRYDKDLMIPINDPYILASKILELSKNAQRLIKLGELNRSFALKRNSDQNISQQLFNAYSETIKNYKKCLLKD